MADPLILLREFNISEKSIIVSRNGKIIFGEFSFAKNMETSYQKNRYKLRSLSSFRSCRMADEGAPREYYNLESVLCLLRNAHLPQSEYVKISSVSSRSLVKSVDTLHLYDSYPCRSKEYQRSVMQIGKTCSHT